MADGGGARAKRERSAPSEETEFEALRAEFSAEGQTEAALKELAVSRGRALVQAWFDLHWLDRRDARVRVSNVRLHTGEYSGDHTGPSDMFVEVLSPNVAPLAWVARYGGLEGLRTAATGLTPQQLRELHPREVLGHCSEPGLLRAMLDGSLLRELLAGNPWHKADEDDEDPTEGITSTTDLFRALMIAASRDDLSSVNMLLERIADHGKPVEMGWRHHRDSWTAVLLASTGERRVVVDKDSMFLSPWDPHSNQCLLKVALDYNALTVFERLWSIAPLGASVDLWKWANTAAAVRALAPKVPLPAKLTKDMRAFLGNKVLGDTLDRVRDPAWRDTAREAFRELWTAGILRDLCVEDTVPTWSKPVARDLNEVDRELIDSVVGPGRVKNTLSKLGAP